MSLLTDSVDFDPTFDYFDVAPEADAKDVLFSARLTTDSIATALIAVQKEVLVCCCMTLIVSNAGPDVFFLRFSLFAMSDDYETYIEGDHELALLNAVRRINEIVPLQVQYRRD